MLDPGAMTESLMDSLRFVGDYHDAARGGSFRLDIDVQAVQAKTSRKAIPSSTFSTSRVGRRRTSL